MTRLKILKKLLGKGAKGSDDIWETALRATGAKSVTIPRADRRYRDEVREIYEEGTRGIVIPAAVAGVLGTTGIILATPSTKEKGRVAERRHSEKKHGGSAYKTRRRRERNPDWKPERP